MKKEYIFLLIIFLAQNFYSQQSLGEGVTTPIASPSMASMATFTDTPVNLTAGVPDINIPIVEVPIQDKNIKDVFSLSYNPAFVDSDYLAASDVGAGWTMFGGSVIYKSVIEELDETYDDVSKPEYKKNIFNDFYYYNLPGISGKFQIKRDTINNTFSLINLTPNNVKFEYQRDSNTATLKINSFTVTDGKGYKYLFNDFDYEARYDGLFGIPVSGYKSAYFLSKIISPIGKVLATFTYDIKSKTLSSGRLIYQYCKLKSVETDLGKVILDYLYDESLADTPNDLYSLQKITLKNSLNQVINTYSFNYITSTYPAAKKRLLASIFKNDKNDVKIEQTSFIYEQERNLFSPVGGSSYCNWGGSVEQSYFDNYKFTNILEKIISPSGGVTQYEYGTPDYFFNFNQQYLDSILNGYVDSDVQYVVSQPERQFDTSQTNNYTFTIAGDPSKKIAFHILFSAEGYHDSETDPGLPPLDNPLNPNPHPQDPYYTNYKIKNTAGEYLTPKSCLLGNDTAQNVFYGYPGTYTMEISGTGHGYGLFIISEIKFYPPPYKNKKSIINVGARLKNVKYYKGINDTTPAKTLSYTYDNEDETASSGYIFYDDHDDQYTANEGFILYKNVKVSEVGNGYTRFTYLSPNDYPKYLDGGTSLYPIYYYPYYNITKSGLTSKKEVYNDQNQLLGSENYTYEFDNYIDQTYQFFISSSPHYSRPAYIKKISLSNKTYTSNGGVIENKRESSINVSNLSPSLVKETTGTGDIIEKQFVYAAGTSGYTHLVNANMVTDPIQTIDKKNGKLISNSQIKFDNNSLLPTSVISINPNDGSVKTVLRYDAYDAKGNLRQFTTASDEASGQGFPTTLIWGYNDTFPIAKIEGATINDIGSLAADIITKSNLDVDDATEKTFMQALDTFRTNTALKNFRITTYTYNPMVGVTTSTSPTGMREIYKYDSSNRLQYVLDVNGNILKNYRYNTKPQP